MAQTLAAKRLRLAGAAVAASTALYDGEAGLKAASAEAAEAGNFTDAELQADPTLDHLTSNLVARVLANIVTDFEAWLDGHESNNVSNPIRRSLLLQMRR